MKIAFPTQENIGLDSTVYNHFGSARFFIIVNDETNESEAIDNHDLNHAHGMCQPLAALGSNKVDAVVSGGIGGGALSKLNAAGIAVYRGTEGTVSENLEMIKTGRLPEFSMKHACTGHEHGECVH